MNKVITKEDAFDMLHDGQRIMISGFAEVGTPFTLIDGLLERNIRDITLIANDTGRPNIPGIAPLVFNHQIKKAMCTHIGTNPETGRQIVAGEIEVELIPQGTFCERIRCGGAGIGGVYLRTGVGTVVAEGKEVREFDGRQYVLERPIRADVALIRCWKVDRHGNMVFRRTARNYNPIMAQAADLVLLEAEEIVEVGELDPDEIMLPGVFVDYVIQAKELDEVWKQES